MVRGWSTSHLPAAASAAIPQQGDLHPADSFLSTWQSTSTPQGPPHHSTNQSISDFTFLFQKNWLNNSSSDEMAMAASASISSLVAPIHSADTQLSPLPLLTSTTTTTPPTITTTHSPALVSSIIHDAARMFDWDRVLHYCQTHPHCAQYRGRDGWTALHHACNRRCPRPEVVEALVHACPEALLQEEEKGWLPLHYACRFKAPTEVVRLLIQLYPDKGRPSVSKREASFGRTPLFYAVRYDAPPGVVSLLLQADPSVVLEEDQNNDSVLALIWDSWAEKTEGIRALSAYINSQTTTTTTSSHELRNKLQADPSLRNRWKQVNTLLRAAFGFHADEDSSSTNRKWRIVHATAAIKCHRSLFDLACALYPEQVRELDENDLRRPPCVGGSNNSSGSGSSQKIISSTQHYQSKQTALHLAASSNASGPTGKYVIQKLLEMYREAAQIKDGMTEALPLHRMVENESKQDWNEYVDLIRAYPRAVRVEDKNGQLPLHRAAVGTKHTTAIRNRETNSSSVIVNLVTLFPEATSFPDKDGYYPLHLIAMHGEEWNEKVESIYNAFPRALQIPSSPSNGSRLPLHLACANLDCQESMLTWMLHSYAEGARVRDGLGRLPLHIACALGRDWDSFVKVLYDAYPESLRIPVLEVHRNDDDDKSAGRRSLLPLHMACESPHSSGRLISELVDRYPGGALVSMGKSTYPLHLACASGKRDWKEDGLERLFQAFPEALSVMDDCGRLPLHWIVMLCHNNDERNDQNSSRDKSSNLYHSTSSCCSSSSSTTSARHVMMLLETVYHMLRAEPSIVSSFCV